MSLSSSIASSNYTVLKHSNNLAHYRNSIYHQNNLIYNLVLLILFLFICVIFILITTQIILVLYLVVLVAIYGYLTPYKQQISNWIELGTLSWFVVLLLLQSNPLLQDTLTYTSQSTSSIPQCDDANTVVTNFALLLEVFYYIPVLVALVCMCIWITTIM